MRTRSKGAVATPDRTQPCIAVRNHPYQAVTLSGAVIIPWWNRNNTKRFLADFGVRQSVFLVGKQIRGPQGTRLRGFPEEPGLGGAWHKTLITLEPS